MQAPTSFQFLRGTDQVYDSDTDSENILFAPHFGGKNIMVVYLAFIYTLRHAFGMIKGA